MRLTNADWSTINLDELRKLPVSDWHARGYHLQKDSGNGCAGDPPGYPTYFTKSVYSRSDNEPKGGFSLVIEHDLTAYGIESVDWSGSWEDHKKKQDALMRRLWIRPPLESVRVQAWIKATFSHHRHCYQVPSLVAQGKNWSDALMVWPVRNFADTPFGKIRREESELEYAQKHNAFDKWRDEEKAKFIQNIRDNNARVARLCQEIATPENHDGTIIVRRFYPEFNPTPELIEPAFLSPGNWWETMAKNPGPLKCPGQYDHKHPVNGSWCQFCGWREEAK